MVLKKLFIFLGLILLLGMVSALPSSVDITYPTNSDYDSEVNHIDWSFGGTLNSTTDFCWYKLNLDDWQDFDCNENPITGIVSNEGDNNWQVKVNDSIGNTQVDSVDFWVDSIYPDITINTPASPDYYTTYIVPFDVDVDELNPLDEVLFSLNKIGSGSNPKWSWFYTLSSGFNNIINSTNPMSTQGLYSFNVSVEDTVGHVSQDGVFVYIDMISPYYSNIQIQVDNVYAPGKDYVFSIQWQDSLSGVDSSSVEFELEGVPYSVTNIGNVYYATVSDLAAGDYDYSWSASDNAGNSNATGTLSYTVDKAYPDLSLSANPSWSEYYQTETSIYGTCPSQITCDLYRNDESVSEPDTQTLGAGSYVYVYNTSGNENYTEASVSETLIITKISPLSGMSLTGTSPIVYGTASDFSGAETNTGDSDCVYELYANDVLVANPDNVVYGYGTINYVYNTSGCSNYTEASVSGSLDVTKALQDAELEINDTDVDYGEAILVTCNGTLYRDGEDVSSENDTAVVLGAGTYNYTCTLDETANFSADSESALVTVNKIPSSVQLYLNSVADNLTVEYMEFFLIEGNVSVGEGNAQLLADGFLITPVNSSGKDVSTNTFMLSGTYNITAEYAETDNYTASSETYFVTVNPRVTTSSSGGSCRTIYSCVVWSEWSACENGEQSRTCLEKERVNCGDGNTSQQLDAGETQACTVPQTAGERGIQEGEPIVVPEAEQGGLSGITGAIIGFAKTGTGILTIITLLVLSAAYGVVHYKRKYS